MRQTLVRQGPLESLRQVLLARLVPQLILEQRVKMDQQALQAAKDVKEILEKLDHRAISEQPVQLVFLDLQQTLEQQVRQVSRAQPASKARQDILAQQVYGVFLAQPALPALLDTRAILGLLGRGRPGLRGPVDRQAPLAWLAQLATRVILAIRVIRAIQVTQDQLENKEYPVQQ